MQNTWTEQTENGRSRLEKVVRLTGFVIIHVFIASFSPARNQMVNTEFTRPVNEMPISSRADDLAIYRPGLLQ